LLVAVSFTWLLIAFPLNPSMMIVGRAIQGFLSGVMLVHGQLYTAEVAHKMVSGRFIHCSRTFMRKGQRLWGHSHEHVLKHYNMLPRPSV
jgi:MFS family permease